MKDKSLLAVLLVITILVMSSVCPTLSLICLSPTQNSGDCGGQGSCGESCESTSGCADSSGGCGTSGSCATTTTQSTFNVGGSQAAIKDRSLTENFNKANSVELDESRNPEFAKASLGCRAGDNSGCSSAATGCGPPSTSTEIFAEPRTEVSFSSSKKEVVLGERVVLTLNITSLVKADCTEFQLLLADNSSYLPLSQAFNVISGSTQWRALFAVGETRIFTIVLGATSEGVWNLVARVSSSNGPGDVISTFRGVRIGVGVTPPEDAAQRDDAKTTPIVAPENHLEPFYTELNTQSDASSVIILADPGTVTIYGWSGTYECKCGGDDEWDFNRGDAGCDCGGAGGGFCDGNNCATRHYHTLHYQEIQLWDENGCSCFWIFCFCYHCDRDGNGPHDCTDRRLATAYTDANGRFQFTNIPNRDGSGNLNSYQLRFYMIGRSNCGCDPCAVDTNGNCTCGCFTILHVEGDAASWDITRANWAWGYIGGVSDGTDYNCGSWVHYDSRWTNLFYHVTKAYDWMLASATGFSMHRVGIMWGSPTSGSGTVMSTGSIWIHDSDAMDGDVVTHEYGHNVMYRFYGNNYPTWSCNLAPDGCTTCWCVGHGGAANACSCDGIGEGWANFFAVLIPEEGTRNWAIDRYCTKGHHYPNDLYILMRDGESNAIVDFRDELTTMRILWDIIDGDNDGEAIQFDFNNCVWDIMSGDSTADNHGGWPQADPRTLREFWDFFLQRFPTEHSYLCRAFGMHDVTNYCNGVNCGCGCVYGTRQCQNCRLNACGGVGCTAALCEDFGCSGVTFCSTTSGCRGAYCNCNVNYCNRASQPCGGVGACNCGINDCTCGTSICRDGGNTWDRCNRGTSLDYCGCGGQYCNCGYETDCVVGRDDYMPCGGVGACNCAINDCACGTNICKDGGNTWDRCNKGTSLDYCGCGGGSCGCGYETDCAIGIDDYRPCGGAAVDTCGCGGSACTCASSYRCNSVPDPYMPCGGKAQCPSHPKCSGTSCSTSICGTTQYCNNAASASLPCPYGPPCGDSTPPTVTITDPPDGHILTGVVGDVDTDGDVDNEDLTIMSNAYGSTPGSPNWNPDADLNHDGLVDMSDIVIVAWNFGCSAASRRLYVTGVASDNFQVAKVEVDVNGGGYVVASGTTSWGITVTIVPGSNVITAKATDGSGNWATYQITVKYVPIKKISLSVVGYSSQTSSYPADKTIDGSNSTYWQTGKKKVTDQWIKYYLGGVRYNLTCLKIFPYGSGYGVKNFKLYVSMDGVTYTEVYANTAQDSATLQYFKLPGIIAKYAELYCVNNYGNTEYIRINEFELYGSVYQNDAGSGKDAGDTFKFATLISPSSYTGYADKSFDPNDYYKFSVTVGKFIDVTMTPPTGWDYDLYLYDASGILRAYSIAGGDASEHILYKADSTGDWRIRIYVWSSGGKGEYSFTVTLKNAMHIESISFSTVWEGRTQALYITVKVLDQNGVAVSGATVTGTLVLPSGSQQSYSGVTGTGGTVTFKYSVKNSALPTGTYTFTVNSVAKTGWVYDTAANKETSDSYTV